MRSRAAVAGLLLSLCATAAAPATAALPVIVLAERTITGTEVYEDTTILVAGTVTVTGSLAVRRSMIVAAPGSLIRGPGAIEFGDVVAEGLGIAVDGGNATLTRTTLSRSAGDLIAMTGGTLTATAVRLEAAGIVALRAGGGASITADGLHVLGTNGYGVRLADATLAARDLTVQSATDYGLFAQQSAIDITESAFGGHCGVYLASGTTGSLRDSSFAAIDHGLTLYHSGSVALRDLSFVGGAAGLTAVGVALDAKDIDASGVERAVVAIGATGLVERGTIDASDAAVEIDGAAAPEIRSLDLSASPVGVRNVAAVTADARWNWWGGTPNAPGAAATQGPVDVSPWLIDPPA